MPDRPRQRAVYERARDADLWTQVDEYVEESRIPFSALVALALREYLAKHAAPHKR